MILTAGQQLHARGLRLEPADERGDVGQAGATDTLVDLRIATAHRINARADTKVTGDFVAELKRVSGKENILFKMTEAALGSPESRGGGRHLPGGAGRLQDAGAVAARVQGEGHLLPAAQAASVQGLLLPKDFEDRRAENYAKLRKPLDPQAFVDQLRGEMDAELSALNDALAGKGLAWLKIAERRNAGAIHLTPLDAAPEPRNLRRLKAAIRERWGVVPLVDMLTDDLYYLEGAPPYARLTLPPGPSALLIVNLGASFRIRAGTDIETAEYADGCVVTTPTRALEFGYPLRTRSVGVHFKPWGLAPFLPMPAAELCDRPVTIEQVWGRPAIAELRDRLATADGPHEMLTLLEQELMRRLCETAGLGWSAIRAASSRRPAGRWRSAT
ncbi:hypothetical protein SAMN05216275_13329 [Streptosporangium canum]|uniref:Uncharacterized protein n=1 Tax=Streptosporangium canum TaxID=324952 RepID=A0A1I4BVN1_9ACTN|nr:hypothetical protein SAMN05216275_13329 [Streptosporangium canum]